jgi:hypothetical protein
MPFLPKPKFVKKNHHVVPEFWQKCFAAPESPGPYYLNVKTGKKLPAQGPGIKMSEGVANIVFDDFFRPSDQLEDRLADLETKMAQGLDALIATGKIDIDARIDIAMMLAVQACRYPERFVDRLELGKYLAIAIKDVSTYQDANALNFALRSTGMLPGASLTEKNFELIKQSTRDDLASQLDTILNSHGYENFYNPNLIIDAAYPVCSHLLALDWNLLSSPTPAFILSDRPVPTPIGYGFSVGLTASYGLILSQPTSDITNKAIRPRQAKKEEIEKINDEVKFRSHEWICGPGKWVHEFSTQS